MKKTKAQAGATVYKDLKTKLIELFAPKEEEAYEVASLLMWLLPLLVTVSAGLEFLFLFLFNRFGHPWAGILSKN